jgi:hypothetical protein
MLIVFVAAATKKKTKAGAKTKARSKAAIIFKRKTKRARISSPRLKIFKRSAHRSSERIVSSYAANIQGIGLQR